MTMPLELGLLFDWIESNGLFVDNDGGRIGFLFPEDERQAGWTETERPGGTNIEFGAAGNANLHHWFGHNRPEIINRLCVFAQTGAEGSEAAFWIDDNGDQRIVHLARVLALCYAASWQTTHLISSDYSRSDMMRFVGTPNLQIHQTPVKTEMNCSSTQTRHTKNG